MIPDEDELLVSAHVEIGGLVGVRHGAEFAARRLRKNVHEIGLDVNLTPEAAVRRVEKILADEGTVIRTEPGSQDGSYEVVGLVGAGFKNLNPAVVTVTIRRSGDGSQLVVRGAAKEGLIKQRAGEAAATRVADALA